MSNDQKMEGRSITVGGKKRIIFAPVDELKPTRLQRFKALCARNENEIIAGLFLVLASAIAALISLT